MRTVLGQQARPNSCPVEYDWHSSCSDDGGKCAAIRIGHNLCQTRECEVAEHVQFADKSADIFNPRELSTNMKATCLLIRHRSRKGVDDHLPIAEEAEHQHINVRDPPSDWNTRLFRTSCSGFPALPLQYACMQLFSTFCCIFQLFSSGSRGRICTVY